MATFTKVNDWVANAVHAANLSSDSLLVALSNTAPGSETSNPLNDTNGILGNVTEISYTNLSSRAITTSSSSQTSGTYSLVLTDLTLSASGGSVAAFQYVYVYDDTVASPVDPLIGMYDYGSALTLNDGESLTIDWGADAGGTGTLFTLA